MNSSDSQKGNKIRRKNYPINSEIGTFWTLCPYCYYMYEFDAVYEECCLRCENCRRPFHGFPVAPPPVVEGKEQYCCGIGYFPLMYDLGGCLSDKKEEGGGGDSFLGGKQSKNGNFVVVSDDSDDNNGGCGSEEKEENKNRNDCMVSADQEGALVQEIVRSRVKTDGMMKVNRKMKSVARNTKKIMGRGKKVMMTESTENQENGVAEEDGDYEIYVGFKN